MAGSEGGGKVGKVAKSPGAGERPGSAGAPIRGAGAGKDHHARNPAPSGIKHLLWAMAADSNPDFGSSDRGHCP
jgi:hypothetical protein